MTSCLTEFTTTLVKVGRMELGIVTGIALETFLIGLGLGACAVLVVDILFRKRRVNIKEDTKKDQNNTINPSMQYVNLDVTPCTDRKTAFHEYEKLSNETMHNSTYCVLSLSN